VSGFVRRGPYALAAGTLSSPVWIPLKEAEWRRGVFIHTRSRRGHPERPPLPFGWAAERCYDRNAWECGPAWYILPRLWIRGLRSWAYDKALRLGAAEALYDGCYYSEIRWWPAQRWT
jgi:hypothetical protein